MKIILDTGCEMQWINCGGCLISIDISKVLAITFSSPCLEFLMYTVANGLQEP
jgi:hypothetical protein